MALINCEKCGHIVSDRAPACPKCGSPVKRNTFCTDCGRQIPNGMSACPNCGDPTYSPASTDRRQQSIVPQNLKKQNYLFWFILFLVLLFIGVEIIYTTKHNRNSSLYEKQNDEGVIIDSAVLYEEQNDEGAVGSGLLYEEQNDEVVVDSVLADGNYTFKGKWESAKHSAQPCKLEFEKVQESLVNCAYTNLKFNERIPLEGTIKGNMLHLVGEKILGKPLVMDLEITSYGNVLVGEGVDYAHSGLPAKMNLTKD